jgi:hypothetical protein
MIAENSALTARSTQMSALAIALGAEVGFEVAARQPVDPALDDRAGARVRVIGVGEAMTAAHGHLHPTGRHVGAAADSDRLWLAKP